MGGKEEKGKDMKTGSGSMVANHPISGAISRKKKKHEELHSIEKLAKEEDLKTWETAGLMRAAGWAEGKQVTMDEFVTALSKFRGRPQGSGRI